MIALCMGEFGLMSRVLAPKFGGFLTFASAESERHGDGLRASPPSRTLRMLHRFDAIGPDTKRVRRDRLAGRAIR